MQRRKFIKNVATASAVVSASSILPRTALSNSHVSGANERVRVGLIGCGGRGTFVAKAMMEKDANVEYVALCDLYPVHLDRSKKWAPRARTYNDFRQLLEHKELDAVHIATPDHWHAVPTIMAAQAGKDIYLEKPTGHTIRENQAILKAVKKAGIVFQTGTQHRSAPHWEVIREIIQSGQLGVVRYIRVWNSQNTYPHGLGRQPDSDPPAGVDWDTYLGPAPYVPFNKNRFVGTYRWYLDYCNGIITDYGAHRLDSMHQVMEQDTPKTISASAHVYDINEDGGDIPDVLQVTYEYTGFTVSYESLRNNAFGCGGFSPGMKYYNGNGKGSRPNGLCFYGSNGTLWADRIGFEIFPEGDKMPRQTMQVVDSTPAHAKNFVGCVRSRKETVAPIELGHKGANACMLGNIAWQFGEKLHWDGDKEEITNHKGANKLLGRKARPGWWTEYI